jgi:hypothetical protein
MRFPPRLAHLATRAVVLSRLLPTYAQAHQLDEEEARGRLDTALRGPLLEDLLEATWRALLGSTKRLKEDGLLEKVATSLTERPHRPGRKAAVTPGWSAFLLRADVAAGTVSDAARKVLESEDGRRRTQAGVEEVGAFLAAELTRGR